MSDYRILKAHSTESLQNEVNLLRMREPDWRLAGGPFIEPWAQGHGAVFAVPSDRPELLFVNFCQALEKP